MTREEIANQLKKFTEHGGDHEQVKLLMRAWLEDRQEDAFTQKQILNDLTSYPEYLSLVN